MMPESTGPGEVDPDDDKYSDITKGEYWEIGRYHVPGTSVLEKDIWFGVIKAGAPKEQHNLKARIERTLSSLRSIYAVDDTTKPQAARNLANFDTAFEKLLSLTAAGLGTLQADPAVADAALDALQSEVVDREAGRMKNAYMIRLGIPALLAATAFAAMYFVYQYVPPRGRWPAEIYNYRHVFLVLSGCMMGTWASFAARKVVLGFLDLAVLEQDRLDPKLRLIFTGVLTIFLTLVIVTGMVDIVIGGFHASRLVGSGTVALLMGALAGLTEQTLPAALLDRARSFVQAVNKTD
jgi:hypothetical protein